MDELKSGVTIFIGKTDKILYRHTYDENNDLTYPLKFNLTAVLPMNIYNMKGLMVFFTVFPKKKILKM